MFSSKTAWFSTSVSNRKRKLWGNHGGLLAGVEDAEFLFSQDTEANDTESLFLSEAYLEEHVAIFHPNYICECVKKGNTKDVVLGQYFFPPKDVQNIARKQLQYKWDLDGNTSDETDHNLESDEDVPMQNLDSKQKQKKSNTTPKKSPQKSKTVNTNASPKDKHNKNTSATIAESRPGPSNLVDNVPKQVISEQKSPKKNTPDEPGHQGHARKHVESRTSENNVSSPRRISETPTKGIDIVKRPNLQSTLSDRVMNEKQDREECLQLADLAKVSSDLHDFIVGQNGCELVLLS